ncbi:hypothetical protein RO03_09945 [Fusobacterium nucleatum subsp. nucleatum]|uniref:Hemolysin n=1 Tax=Fusobacterium nucleatum subsp. nucleatum TaxID=76856 RepID=A0A101K578_FUSNC|nr:hypothetical protein [Fusobacterium nucleatum]KUL97735.1 hypothetical protein RO03_09920 [Fusobacterium nucleatum subsp. nucleatum]KUL97739.1 hypothetical protein RO03_09945 [Fusobacterium nucleatum subsp. nucleatum]
MENSTDYYEQQYYKSYTEYLIRKNNSKETLFNYIGKGAVEGVKTVVLLKILGVMPRSKPNLTFPKSSKFYKDTRYPISAEDMYVISVNDPEYYRDNSHLYKVTGKLNLKPGLYNKKIGDPTILRHMTEYHNNTLIEDEKLGYIIGNLGGYVVGYKILNRPNAYIYKKPNPSLVPVNEATNGGQLLLEYKVNPIQSKVFLNDGTLRGTTVANQIRFTDSSGNMFILQNNLTTRETSLQTINSLGQRTYANSLTPYPANALIGTSTSTSALTQISYQIPVMNGATRAMQYSSQWENASLTEAINRFAPNAKPVETSKGKVIYSNNETGVSVVYDKNGNYFRIEDTTKPRGRNYLDINGNDMNNEIVNGKQRGRNRADYQKVTHFNNTD